MKKKGLFGGLLLGAGLGMLFAPKTGKETRSDLKEILDDLVKKAKDIDSDDVKNYVITKSEEIEAAIKDLNKEKALDIAKKKAKDIENATKNLASYVKKKGSPILEDTVESLRNKAIVATKGVLEKLEQK